MAAVFERTENWGSRKWGCCVFLSIMVIHGFAILLFTRGFLLTRSELSQYSQCGDVLQSPCFPPQQNGSACWNRPAVNRLVIIVLDALRFDFVAPSTFFPEKKPWMDKLQVLHEYASQNQSTAKIFKAIADPPTTSLQRLKGLTTGGLPTFIDVGNSFGAPAIVEDNLIYQMVQNGKRVVVMGDDTWVQLFPDHFVSSYPFPSFNVKDLHTVDNGCITNLLPSLYEDNWDVLIAHFLGVDHAGHIFGVDSVPMVEKLQQYNEIIKEVVGVLENESRPGGLHENTMLVVMGDHGQTLNGDHGGGTAEEVETAIFALSLKKPPTPQQAAVDSSSCKLDTHEKKICIYSIQQLDFAVTISALLGLPFPFGSIGRVDSELFSLAGSAWDMPHSMPCSDQRASEVDTWMQNYVNVLCINSWQVKKYIDVYSSLSLIGFSDKDLLHVSELYAKAQELWALTSKNSSIDKSQGCFASLPSVKKQIDAYSLFLSSVAELARSSWTEFNLKIMGIGFGIMLCSIFLHSFFIKRLEKLCELHSQFCGDLKSFFGVNFAIILVLIRACSFLSNSYILEEGRVAGFLLATIVILQLRCAAMKKMRLIEALVLCILLPLIRIGIELGQLKQAVSSLFLKLDPSKTTGIGDDSPIWVHVSEILPVFSLIVLAFLQYKSIAYFSQGILKYVTIGTLFNLILIPLHWASESSMVNLQMVPEIMKGNSIPRVTYAAGLLQLSLVAISVLLDRKRTSNWEERTVVKALALLSVWSPTIIVLSGKQGPLVFLAFFIGGWCLTRLMTLEQRADKSCSGSSISYALPVTQWSLFSVCMFFSTGHWCAFDGLRYAAAFIGFDEFNLIRQAILLTIETFGFSHILPICGLPLLVATQKGQSKQVFSMRLCQVYLIYGLISAVTFTFTMLCVTIHRRHLMVWGLFAPKFVFDTVGLVLIDLMIFLSSLYYIM
ncbi:uncharacterized protein [Primulina eburnea]|uniref:uncharacterized protein n=1 Tax=Primulina eburnea TaxID=1245227 RepID=UPI003C6C43C0